MAHQICQHWENSGCVYWLLFLEYANNYYLDYDLAMKLYKKQLVFCGLILEGSYAFLIIIFTSENYSS